MDQSHGTSDSSLVSALFEVRGRSRTELMTPCLVVDLSAFEANVATMADLVSGREEKLRPHAKTHKSATIARKQIESGAVGICCAKLGEAVELSVRGMDGIMITSPVVGARKIELLLDLNDQLDELIVAIDNPANLECLAVAAMRRSKRLSVIVDLGMGRNRTGVPTPEAAGSLASAILQAPGLRLRGLQAYAGHLQHIRDAAERRRQALVEHRRIRSAVAAMTAAGFARDIVAGSGTGTCEFDTGADVFTELEVGSYIFMDTDYNLVETPPDRGPRFRSSLFVQATVISTSVPGRATIDAGFKALATDGPPPRVVAGAGPGATFVFMGDEHGAIVLPEGAPDLRLGDMVVLEAPHCDPTVNLYDRYYCIRDDIVEDIWTVDARGASW